MINEAWNCLRKGDYELAISNVHNMDEYNYDCYIIMAMSYLIIAIRTENKTYLTASLWAIRLATKINTNTVKKIEKEFEKLMKNDFALIDLFGKTLISIGGNPNGMSETYGTMNRNQKIEAVKGMIAFTICKDALLLEPPVPINILEMLGVGVEYSGPDDEYPDPDWIKRF